MKILTQRAEERLLTKFKSKDELIWHRFCLHIKGRLLDPQIFTHLPKALSALLREEGGEIYLCHDQDIFIFSFSLNAALFPRLKNHIFTYIEKFGAPPDNFMSFYDLDQFSLGLTELIELKLDRRLDLEKQSVLECEIKKAEQGKSRFNNYKPGDDLLKGIIDKRHGRHDQVILIVEDDPFSRKLIGTALGDKKVFYAECGLSALETFVKHAPDIVFLDIELPDVTGHDVLSRLLEFDRQAFIVMLSGNSQSENVMLAMRSGAKGFIGKPFTKDKLFQYINKCSVRPSENMEVS